AVLVRLGPQGGAEDPGLAADLVLEAVRLGGAVLPALAALAVLVVVFRLGAVVGRRLREPGLTPGAVPVVEVHRVASSANRPVRMTAPCSCQGWCGCSTLMRASSAITASCAAASLSLVGGGLTE